MRRLELRLIASYLLWWLLFAVSLFVVDVVLVLIFGATYPTSSGTSIVLAAVPAMMPGRLYYKRVQAQPPKSYCWRMAAWFAVLNTVVGTVLYAVLQPSALSTLMNSWAIVVLIFAALAQLLLTRFFFSMGAKQLREHTEKQTGKGLTPSP